MVDEDKVYGDAGAEPEAPAAENQAQAPPAAATAAAPAPGPASTLQGPTAQAAANIPQNPAVQPPPPHIGTFDRVLQVLAGSPQKNVHYDPNTGKVTSDPVTSRGDLAMHIVAAAVTGMLRGAAAPPGPGQAARGGALALEGGLNDQMRAHALQSEQFEREQKAQVQRYQNAHLNAETALNTASAQHVGLENLKAISDANADHLQQLADQGAVETDETGKPVLLTLNDIQAKIKSGELDPGSQIGIQGGFAMLNGKPVATFAVNHNPNAPVVMSQQHADYLKSQGVSVPAEIIGQKIPSKSLTTYDNQAGVNSTGTALLAELKKEAGGNNALGARLPGSFDPSTPGLGTALRQYQRALQGAKDGNLYEAMEILNQHNPNAAKVLLSAIGGGNAVEGTNIMRAANQNATIQLDAQKKQAENQASPENRAADKADIAAFQKNLGSFTHLDPGTRKDLISQTQRDGISVKDLTALRTRADISEQSGQQAAANKESAKIIADSNRSVGLANKGIDKIDEATTKGKDSYLTGLAVANELRSTVKAAKNGDELATQISKTIGIHSVNSVAGLARVSPAEYEAVGEAGSLYRQVTNVLVKAGSGALSQDTMNEINNLGQRALDSKYQSYLAAVNLIDKNTNGGRGTAFVAGKYGKIISVADANRAQYGTNAKNGEPIVSYDGGKTWDPAK